MPELEEKDLTDCPKCSEGKLYWDKDRKQWVCSNSECDYAQDEL